MEQHILNDLAYLKSLFERRLVDDRAKTDLIMELKQRLRKQDDLLEGWAFSQLFREIIVAIDRLRRFESSQDLSDSVYEEVMETMIRRGLQELPTETYDATLHTVVATETKPNLDHFTILEVVETGYQLGDRVLRPAKVVVSVRE